MRDSPHSLQDPICNLLDSGLGAVWCCLNTYVITALAQILLSHTKYSASMKSGRQAQKLQEYGYDVIDPGSDIRSHPS